MRKILHILSEPDDVVAKQIIDEQKNAVKSEGLTNCRIEVVLLSEGFKNYEEIVEKIFEADSVQVW